MTPDAHLEPWSQLGQAVLALALVTGLLLGLAWLLQRVQGKRLFASASLDPNLKLSVESSLHLDPKTRLVLVRRGRVGHLICVNAQGASVVEQGIALPELPVKEKPHDVG